MTKDSENYMSVAHLESSCALIWPHGTRRPKLYVNPTIDDPEDEERNGKPVTAQELMFFAYMSPNTVYAPCRSVIRVYLDNDTGEEEKMLKLTAIEALPKVLATLQMVVRRSISLSRR